VFSATARTLVFWNLKTAQPFKKRQKSLFNMTHFRIDVCEFE
jgi:hypothetical protein